jgi:hypothetical protein
LTGRKKRKREEDEEKKGEWWGENEEKRRTEKKFRGVGWCLIRFSAGTVVNTREFGQRFLSTSSTLGYIGLY